MTAKEKAEELFNLFLPLVQRWDDFRAVSIKKENARSAAKIAAKEIKRTHYDSITVMWWEDVEREIEKI